MITGHYWSCANSYGVHLFNEIRRNAGAAAGILESEHEGPGRPADRLSGAGIDTSQRDQSDRNVAEEPQGEERCNPRRDHRRGGQVQDTALPGETFVAAMVTRIAELDTLIEARFHEHRHAAVIRSLPGMGAFLGAECHRRHRRRHGRFRHG